MQTSKRGRQNHEENAPPRAKRKVDRYDPSFSQLDKPRKCNKKLRRTRSKSPSKPCFLQPEELEEMDHETIIKYICLTSIAEDHGVNLLETTVYLCKLYI